jgi:type II secretion system protein J
MNLLPQKNQTPSTHSALGVVLENIQHSTFNAQHPRTREHAPFGVECWKLNVECFFIPKTPRRHAFTLIEIMMAMAIFSMVVTAIYATWTLIIKSAKIGQEAAAQVQRERVAFRTFEDALVCARSFQADLQHYSFVVENGSSPTLSFVARLPEFFPRSGRFGDFDVRRVTFSLENGSEGQQQLVLRQTPILMETDETEQQYPFVLSRNVSKMEFELWDARKGKWVDEWTTTNEIPSMIHLTLTYSRHNPDKPYSTPQTEVVSRVVDISSTMVPGGFQRRGQSTGNTNNPGGGTTKLQ